jgi:hypothetical protein
MSTARDLVEKHLEIWSDTDRDRRRKEIYKLYTVNSKGYDPFYPDVIVGRDALMTLIDEIQMKFPMFAFSIISGTFDEHHGAVRFKWYFGPVGNSQAITGQDFMIIENEFIIALYIFIEKPAD